MSSRRYNELDGALLVDKPQGMTSHDVVDGIRRRFALKKVGHCGTLDPNATGLLVIVVGRGTKLSERLMADDKTYSGAVRFGEATDTHDTEGRIISSREVPPLTVEDLNGHAQAFLGDQMQTPPMVSAVKQGGVPLYKLARKGVEVERKARLIHIYQFRFNVYREPVGEFIMACTKGTYVRSIVHDLGEKIGCGAHLATLRRLESGRFQVADATPYSRIMAMEFSDLIPHVLAMSVIGKS